MDVQEIWMPLEENSDLSIGHLVYTFEVTEAWKGVKENRLIVWTTNGTNGYFFEAGKEYLVYASKTDTGLYTSDCYGNKPIEEARRDLRELGRPRRRFPASTGNRTMPRTP